MFPFESAWCPPFLLSDRESGCHRDSREIDAIEADVISAQRSLRPRVARFANQYEGLRQGDVDAGERLQHRRPRRGLELVGEDVARLKSTKSPVWWNLYRIMPAPAPTYSARAAGIHANRLIERPRAVR